jgi:hypothetical protein
MVIWRPILTGTTPDQAGPALILENLKELPKSGMHPGATLTLSLQGTPMNYVIGTMGNGFQWVHRLERTSF